MESDLKHVRVSKVEGGRLILGARTPSSAHACAARASLKKNGAGMIVRAARSLRARAPALPVLSVLIHLGMSFWAQPSAVFSQCYGTDVEVFAAERWKPLLNPSCVRSKSSGRSGFFFLIYISSGGDLRTNEIGFIGSVRPSVFIQAESQKYCRGDDC